MQESNLVTELEPRVKIGNSKAVALIIWNLLDHKSYNKIESQLNKAQGSLRKWKSAPDQYQDFLYDNIETNIEPGIANDAGASRDSWDVNE